MNEHGRLDARRLAEDYLRQGGEDPPVDALEVVDAVGQLLKTSIRADQTPEWWYGDRLRVFLEAVVDLRERGVVTDEQAIELLSLFIAQESEAEVSTIIFDLLDASLKTVARHMNVGPEFAASGRRPAARMDVRAASTWGK